MWTSLAVFVVAAFLCAAMGFWVLRAYRRAGGGAQSPRPALMVSGAVALMALGTYLAIGRPDLPDAPYQQRIDALIAALRSSHPPPITPEQELAIWAHLTREHPRALTPHLKSGDTLFSLGRAREASLEYAEALRIDPTSSDAMLGMGRSIAVLNNGVTPEALTFFVQAGEHGNDPAPWIYQAMAAMQDGRTVDAQRLWGEAAQRMSADDPRRAMAEQMSHEARP